MPVEPETPKSSSPDPPPEARPSAPKAVLDVRSAIALSVIGMVMLVALCLATCSGVAYD